ncbi:MAG: fasciclin domain-containing protein [Armatimonadetes bacterium]|nr:fasciclin domain-containing protein [Armatimonadota bacterium]MDW8028348.1 fasciclin domain-containing protein [Armatimonadota bacterium]
MADIVEIAVQAGNFKTLVAAVQAAGLVDALKQPGPFTVFAPTDDAFAKLPPGTVDDLLKPENKDKLVKVLTYHVVEGKHMCADVKQLPDGAKVPTLSGESITVTFKGDDVFVDGAKVVSVDIEADNGVIHVIDAVILPPSL